MWYCRPRSSEPNICLQYTISCRHYTEVTKQYMCSPNENDCAHVNLFTTFYTIFVLQQSVHNDHAPAQTYGSNTRYTMYFRYTTVQQMIMLVLRWSLCTIGCNVASFCTSALHFLINPIIAMVFVRYTLSTSLSSLYSLYLCDILIIFISCLIYYYHPPLSSLY